MDATRPDLLPPDLDEIEALARAALSALPERYRAAASGVVLRVTDWPDDETLDDLDIDDPYDLTGLYEGVPMTEKSVMDTGTTPDTIWLFRRPILDEWSGRGDIALGDLVAHVLVHELAHHLGWSDEEIARIDRWWE